ncbi:hypothetical protein CQW23_12315 [Capsicum baccatum]|uniref:DUF1639 domain-containing protein n=1 Tax=Capsicum baccatum TaxID=33114 RepID=A0A2G2WS88_CAPBA|nr:hypothetical protein CQW23_12315 [Capsicum baccatum]
MAMGPERSKALHNFTLPYGLKWGNQRHLRCAKVESNGEIASVHRRSNGSESIRWRIETETVDRNRSNDRLSWKFKSPEKEGIGAVREKLMFDLVTEADKMKDKIFQKKLKIGTNKANVPSPLKTENKSPNLRSGEAAGASSVGEKRQRMKYSVTLSRREIEEDFMAMIQHRPPRRPKKRAKLVQKNLDTLFPGLWLTEITADLYEVPDDQ